jgi:hypothetical protein
MYYFPESGLDKKEGWMGVDFKQSLREINPKSKPYFSY